MAMATELRLLLFRVRWLRQGVVGNEYISNTTNIFRITLEFSEYHVLIEAMHVSRTHIYAITFVHDNKNCNRHVRHVRPRHLLKSPD